MLGYLVVPCDCDCCLGDVLGEYRYTSEWPVHPGFGERLIRYLKMDLIAACVALASLMLVVKPGRFLTSQDGLVTDQAYVPANGVSVTEKASVTSGKLGKKMRHPFQALANFGVASWYGSVLHGHRTASGETFDKDALTACHRTLPFGTLVRVVDVSSGKSVVVRINDRGVLAPERVIDLSSAAANELGILRAGVAKVRLEILKKVERKAEKPAVMEEAESASTTVPVPSL